MALIDELTEEVKGIFKERWDVADADVVPAPEDVRLGNNHAKRLGGAAILYADLDGSTRMVDTTSWMFSAEIYKVYLHCAGRLIRHCGGEITAYDGDRIMGIFVGKYKNTSAVECAFNINHAVVNIINPSIKNQYPEKQFEVKHVVGIDSSEIRAARTGVRADNDIVWVGRAANYAARLAALPSTHAIRITKTVFDAMNDSMKKRLDGSFDVWESATWTAMGNLPIYRTNYWRKPG